MTKKGQRRQSRRKSRWYYVGLPILVALLIGIGVAWVFARQGNAGSSGTESQLSPISQLPQKVRSAPPVVQEAYQYAIANPETLAKYPCYCGCGNMGHASNLHCFVEEFKPDGSIVFDYHALG